MTPAARASTASGEPSPQCTVTVCRSSSPGSRNVPETSTEPPSTSDVALTSSEVIVGATSRIVTDTEAGGDDAPRLSVTVATISSASRESWA